jgi:DNA-binding transcriptional LysR family regulator
VIEDGYDAVIRSGEPDDSRLMHKNLGNFLWRLVAAPSYLAARGMPQTPRDIPAHSCLRQRFPETGKVVDWMIALPDNVAVPVTLSASGIEPLAQLAIAGHGIALLPDFAVRAPLHSGSLIEVLPGYVKRTGTIRLLWPASRFPLPKVSAFVHFMGEHVAAALSEDAR